MDTAQLILSDAAQVNQTETGTVIPILIAAGVAVLAVIAFVFLKIRK